MNNTALVTIPLSIVDHARRNHQLEYRNNRAYDYTYAHFPVIPHTVSHWADHGINLTGGFIETLWEQHASKKPGGKPGEIRRTEKLVLDALKATYDQSAFAEYTGCQVTYRPSDDMIGRDLQIHIPNIGKFWLQMRVLINADYSELKRRRQAHRPAAGDVIDACATVNDLDTDHQPYVPTAQWYRNTISELRTAWIIANLLPDEATA